MNAETLEGLDPFDILDAEAARLDAYFGALTEPDWDHASRCDGWSVRDVLAHLAGEELYNHACLDDDLDGLFARLEEEGIEDLAAFNDWTVLLRRDLPVGQVLAEWRRENGETRRRMRALGADATLQTMAGPYPVGLQTFHYCSEFATHADDVNVPVEPGEEPGRTAWRARVGIFVLDEQDSPVRVEGIPGGFRVELDDLAGELSSADFVDATTGRLSPGHALDPELRDALVCLA
ncbi:maleylpyruvate isomerase family mycothiol-dependent enzyme [Actinomadura viridis]|uniref:maleylpyruvate isomerase family mycothiol-dependent enzyme n=1 Tax=Actinomadura viridis TaxID=58110 RepID=UPI0036BEDE4A